MRLFISFSARKNGNSDEIAKYLSLEDDKIIFFRNLNISSCKTCNYECFSSECKYRNDDIYTLYEEMKKYQKVILIVPMYCGNPSSLYFIFNERCQDYFMHNESEYENIIKRLFIIGIYGNKEQTPDFIPCFEKWFNCTKYTNHVLGIERHKYNLKIEDSILNITELKNQIDEFINPKKVNNEESAMAMVLFGDKILTTNELIYGKNTLSLPKGHKKDGEEFIDTAIRECFEETNIIIGTNNLVKELPSYSYEFLNNSNQLIRKTIIPFLFIVNSEGTPLSKEERIISTQWMNIDEFINNCTYDSVKKIVTDININKQNR
ncbi:MAG: NUDIX domain-containing protein [Erysipelotrichales bacterium]|nr:NUDIX domain-containing protein [Erysipelotrichales bacterium]